MNLQNNAELVILSACNTAGGNIKQSEGFSGLARAFLFSGSKSVLVSNWYVETYAAMELTTGMIKQIKYYNFKHRVLELGVLVMQ